MSVYERAMLSELCNFHFNNILLLSINALYNGQNRLQQIKLLNLRATVDSKLSAIKGILKHISMLEQSCSKMNTFLFLWP